jgi:hypothetical protein
MPLQMYKVLKLVIVPLLRGKGQMLLAKDPLELVLLQYFLEENQKNSILFMPIGIALMVMGK